MINLKDATTIAKRYITELNLTSDIQCSLIETPIEAGEFCYVFGYQSSKYLETRDFQYSLAGNAPVIIDRKTSECIITGTAQSAKFYLENYEERGDPFKQKSATIKLNGWNEGAQAISAIKAIRNHTNLGLYDSKKAIDDCLSGNSSEIVAVNEKAAERLVKELRKSEFLVKQV